ncbi:MAG: hypothetical protein ACYDBJ_19560, partial [Aggregatilineales bacterium]
RALALNASLSSAPPSSITLLTSSGSPPNLRPQIRMHPREKARPALKGLSANGILAVMRRRLKPSG